MLAFRIPIPGSTVLTPLFAFWEVLSPGSILTYMSRPIHSTCLHLWHSCCSSPLGLGVLLVCYHDDTQPHTPSSHFVGFPPWTPRSSRYASVRLLTAPPQDHEPTISSTINLPICEPIFISPTSYRNSPMGPPPFISFPGNFCPPWGTHFTLGHLFLYFVHLSHIYSLFVINK